MTKVGIQAFGFSLSTSKTGTNARVALPASKDNDQDVRENGSKFPKLFLQDLGHVRACAYVPLEDSEEEGVW